LYEAFLIHKCNIYVCSQGPYQGFDSCRRWQKLKVKMIFKNLVNIIS
jgi:hypothetical protein